MGLTLLTRWHVGVGDPTFLGWATTAGYLVACLLCLRAFGVRRRARSKDAPTLALDIFWLTVAMLLALLGVNKQLDVQTLVIDVGRDLSLQQGFYAQRHRLKKGLIIAMVLAAGGTGLGLVYGLRRWLSQVVVALVGLALLGCFVIARAALFQSVNPLPIGWAENFAWLLETSGIALIALNAHRVARPSKDGLG